MKKALIIILLLKAVVVNAQMPAKYAYAKRADNHYNVVKGMLCQSFRKANKTSLSKERLRGSRYFTNNFRPSLNIYDSSVYKYSGNNGSEFDLNEVQYNFPATQFDYDRPMFNTHVYAVDGPEVKCDTAIGKNLGSSGLELANTTIANYDASGLLLTYKSVSVDTSYTPSLSYYNTYDGSGKVTVSIYFTTPNGTSWDTATKRYFSYDGTGQLTIDSTYQRNGTTWYLSNKYTYSYDGSGNLIQLKQYSRKNAAAAMLNTYVYNQTYYTGGTLQASHGMRDTGTGLYLAFIDTFGYAAGYDFFNFYTEYSYTNVGWRATNITTKKINAAGVPDTVYKTELIFFYDTSGVLLGSQDIHFKDVIMYNNHNDPTLYYDDIDFGSGFSNNSIQRFYYEPATYVTNTVKRSDLKLYPNPAYNYVYIELGKEMEAKAITIQITDAAGRVMSRMHTISENGTIQVPLIGLSQGIYQISVEDNLGNRAINKIVKE